MFEATVREGALRVRRPGTRWLSSGHAGGLERAPAAYNLTVPEGFEREDLEAYARRRRRTAGFEERGPTLLTGVDMGHARGARLGPVEAYATAGLSNPAALPLSPAGEPRESDPEGGPGGDGRGEDGREGDQKGTVNLLVGTTRALGDGALASLLGVAVEAKAATLLGEAGFPGTTTDAAAVGCDPGGRPATFAGSATAVGSAARACVREAVLASLRARYPERDYPDSVAAAEHGVSTGRRAEVFAPARPD